jgi:hypothetical protein
LCSHPQCNGHDSFYNRMWLVRSCDSSHVRAVRNRAWRAGFSGLPRCPHPAANHVLGPITR